MSTGGGGPQKYLKDAKTLLITALVVVFCLKLLVEALIPLIPYLFGGALIAAIIYIAINRSTKL